MPLLIFALSLYLAAAIQQSLQTYAPSNVVIAHVRRQRPRPRVAGGLLVAAAALMFVAAILSEYVAAGGPVALHLLVLIGIWDGMKFIWLAVVTVLAFLMSIGRRRIRAAS